MAEVAFVMSENVVAECELFSLLLIQLFVVRIYSEVVSNLELNFEDENENSR
jgi:hypothetical protein